MKKVLALVLALAMMFALCACGSSDSSSQAASSDEKVVKIGVFEPTSGQNAAGGKKEILGIEYPVICGAMSWCTDARLCAAISNAGGLGQLAANAGQTELTSDPAVTVERMKAEFEKTLALTDKPFAVNCMTPNPEIPVTAIFSNPMRDWLLTEDRAKIILLSGAPCDEAAEFIRDFKKAGKICIYRDANPVAS